MCNGGCKRCWVVVGNKGILTMFGRVVAEENDRYLVYIQSFNEMRLVKKSEVRLWEED